MKNSTKERLARKFRTRDEGVDLLRLFNWRKWNLNLNRAGAVRQESRHERAGTLALTFEIKIKRHERRPVRINASRTYPVCVCKRMNGMCVPSNSHTLGIYICIKSLRIKREDKKEYEEWQPKEASELSSEWKWVCVSNFLNRCQVLMAQPGTLAWRMTY